MSQHRQVSRLRRRIRRWKRAIARARARIHRLLTIRPQGLSRAGAAAISEFEGFSAICYEDPAGHCSIGYGTLLHFGACSDSDRREWGRISEGRALEMLRTEADAVWPAISRAVTVPLNQNQADALISLVYNIGLQGFLESTLLERINSSAPRSEITQQWRRWVYAGGRVLPGLERRREAEVQLYFS